MLSDVRVGTRSFRAKEIYLHQHLRDRNSELRIKGESGGYSQYTGAGIDTDRVALA